MILTADNIISGGVRRTETEYVVIEEGCLKKFNDVLRLCGLNGAVAGLFDSNTICAKGMTVPDIDQIIVLNADNLHADEKAVREVLSQLRDDVKVLAAFGSGTVTDIARYCAEQRKLAFVSCPTAASVDGFCSSVCAMTFNNTKVTLPAVAPKAVVADLTVIKNAPSRLIKSGLGDILGKYVSLADWRIAHLITGENYCEATARLVKEALASVTDSVKEGVTNGDGFYTQTVYALLLSGLAMQIVGSSRPASGAEHHFSHLLSVAPLSMGIRTSALHGESVGVGTLAMIGRYKAFVSAPQADGEFLRQVDERVKEIRANGNRLHTADFYRRSFDTLADVLCKENENDCLATVDVEMLKDNLNEIRKVIHEIPSEEQMTGLFGKLGMKSSLAEIGVDENQKPLIIGLSPYIRNRLTFNRLLLLTGFNRRTSVKI